MEKNVKYLHWYSFWDNFIFFYPIKILFFAQVCGNLVATMSLFAIQNMSITLLEIPTGCLSDRWGRKWVCCAGAVRHSRRSGADFLTKNQANLESSDHP